jgi:polyphosphate kinase
VLLTSVIRAHLGELFPGRTVEPSRSSASRATPTWRSTRTTCQPAPGAAHRLTTRHFGQAIRLEVVASCPERPVGFLLRAVRLPEAALYKVNGPVNLVRLNQLIDQADGAGAALPAARARLAGEPAARAQSIFERLRQGDVLLHHPFESFEPVVQFLREAVHDPDVLAIKQTIYRTGSESVLMDLLIEAARRGKEVLVVVELKARFDEEANINWAERLEAVGAQVVYGIVGLKTHAKLLLVTRARRAARLRRYAHLSTGNYNPRTARCTPTWATSPPTRPDRRRRRGLPAAGQPDRVRPPRTC